MSDSDKTTDEKLSDDQLAKVSGGYIEEFSEGHSLGCEIKCPNCGNDNEELFSCDCDILTSVQKDLYICGVCGMQFATAEGYGVTDVIGIVD